MVKAEDFGQLPYLTYISKLHMPWRLFPALFCVKPRLLELRNNSNLKGSVKLWSVQNNQ